MRKTELPPLPTTPWCGLVHESAPYEPEWTSNQDGYDEEQMRNYAEAAISAERERCANEEVRKDAERYRWLRARAYKDGATLAIDVAVIDDVAIGDFGEFIDATADAAIAGVTAAGAA